MDKRIAYRVVLDTETAPIEASEQVNPYNMLTYDLGYAIVDKRGNVYRTRSFIIKEIFEGEAERMASAYYADKLPAYREEIEKGERRVVSLALARHILLADMKEFGCTEIYAHNAHFDYGTLTKTAEWVSGGKYHTFFPKGITICDTMKMVNDVLAKTPSYTAYCKKHDFMTKHKTPRTQVKAEVVYRYITGQIEFEESHTGLEDVMIEKEIMAYCFRKHKKMNRVYREL